MLAHGFDFSVPIPPGYSPEPEKVDNGITLVKEGGGPRIFVGRGTPVDGTEADCRSLCATLPGSGRSEAWNGDGQGGCRCWNERDGIHSVGVYFNHGPLAYAVICMGDDMAALEQLCKPVVRDLDIAQPSTFQAKGMTLPLPAGWTLAPKGWAAPPRTDPVTGVVHEAPFAILLGPSRSGSRPMITLAPPNAMARAMCREAPHDCDEPGPELGCLRVETDTAAAGACREVGDALTKLVAATHNDRP
jgi:hypothetical protein